MSRKRFWSSLMVGLVTVLGLIVVGLGGIGCNSPTPGSAETGSPDADQHAAHSHATGEAGEDDHSDWWCVEHGVPEEICARCSTKLAAEFQQKGDWCEEHQRPDSQCFICHPELEQKFAAQYQAKYGKQPPAPTMR